MKINTFTLFFLIFTSSFSIQAQDTVVHPSFIGTGTFLGISKPLRDLPAMTAEEFRQMELQAESKERNEGLQYRSYPFASTALPKGPDPVWQKEFGGYSDQALAPIANFDGQTSPYYPPDCNGTAGPNHFMQTINCVYAIYNKSGTLVAGPTNLNLLFNGVPGSNYNDGDPIILYDEQADRWFVTEFSITGSTDYILMAVSTTNDPTGSWYTYSFQVDAMPDYPKFSIWRDGYYMGDNNSSTKDIYVFERSKILLGQTAQYVGFNNPNRPASVDGFMCVPPVDNDGTFAPSGAPGLFIAFNDDAFGGGSDELWIYELTVNWTTPSSSSFSRVQQLTVPAFDSNFGNNWDNIVQPGTSQKLDAIPQVIMNVPQYRNFGSYQTLVCCHTVDVDNTNHAGIRWYELRKTTGTWSLRQSGTYAPDSHSRWMGSIMLNPNGKIALGYSISSSTVYPGIRYTGQSAGAYSAGNGVLDIPEETIWTGANSQSGYNRWGDYSQMCVDPSDNELFWFTSEYIGSGGSRKTRIASFKFGNAPTVTTTAATNVTGNSATINGTVNPNGLATTYYFEWGTSTSYGSTTTSGSAGAGTSAVAISANLSSLTSGVTYHYRAVGSNTDGTSYGLDMSFTPGAAAVTTTAASAITSTTATSGGNVTTDGGTPVTARGVCWSTSVNPTTSDSHTTDGSGTGVFTSSLTGLTPSTTYHIRAYATNTSGTFYGEDLQFTTLCGIVTTLPFNEGFEGGTTMPSCWSEENSNPAWQFMAGNGSGHPANAHTGSLNAVLKDNTSASNRNKMITPVLNLSGYSNIQLTFWHTQALWSPDQDELRIYDRTSSTGSWNLLATYTQNITTWTQETISLTNASSEYQVAFEGDAKYGYGVCIDDIQITGTSSVNLVVTPSNQDVTAPAGSTSFSVTSNTTWNAVCDVSWCTVTNTGTGNGTIVANYTENTSAAVRVATITVSASGATTQTVTVTQAGNGATLVVLPANQDVTPPAGSTSFTVQTTVAWTAVSDASWCTVTGSGSGNGTITADYGENTSVDWRVANISVTISGLSPVIVTVTQSGVPATLNVTPANRDVSALAGSTDFTVTSNTTWNAASDAPWCVVTGSGSGNGTIVADYAENTDYTKRIANISVTVSGLTPQVVTVSQAASVVSTGDLSKEELTIFPNPATGIFDINTGRFGIEQLDVTIVDYTGKVIQNRICSGERIYSFDLTKAPKGCYFVRIKADGELMVKKLVIL